MTIRPSIPRTPPTPTVETRLKRQIAAAQQQADLAASDASAAQAKIDDTLSGTEAFTGVNVGGVDVAPFLSKTDGSALVDPTALATGVVETDALEAHAVTESGAFYDASTISINGAGEHVLATKSVTVLAGEEVEIHTNAALYALGKNGSVVGQTMSTLMFRIYRDTSMIFECRAAPTLQGIGIPLNVSPTWTDDQIPGPGTFVYETRVEHTDSGDVSASTAGSRYLNPKRVKR